MRRLTDEEIKRAADNFHGNLGFYSEEQKKSMLREKYNKVATLKDGIAILEYNMNINRDLSSRNY